MGWQARRGLRPRIPERSEGNRPGGAAVVDAEGAIVMGDGWMDGWMEASRAAAQAGHPGSVEAC